MSIPPSKQTKLHSTVTIAASKMYFVVNSTHNATFNKMELPFCMKKTWQFLQRPKLLGSPDNKTPSSAINCQFREELKVEQDVILILEEIWPPSRSGGYRVLYPYGRVRSCSPNWGSSPWDNLFKNLQTIGPTMKYRQFFLWLWRTRIAKMCEMFWKTIQYRGPVCAQK